MNKFIFNLFIQILFSVLASCSEEKVSEITELVYSFSVILDGGVVDGVIDHSSGTIQLPGISNGNLINDVSYELCDEAIFYPEPYNFIGVWDKEMNIVVRLGSEVKNYTIILPDYKEKVGGIIHINPDIKAQKVEFIGGDMERSQAFLQKAANPEDVAQWCFSDVHFDICRVSYDKKQELIKGEKNYAFYDASIKSMQLLKQVNPNIKFWATLKSDYNGYGGENNLPEWIYNSTTKHWNSFAYAHFLKDYLILMDKNGVHIDYMSISKEWIQVINAQREIEVITELKAACERNNIEPPLFVGPASWGISQGISFLNQVSQKNKTDLYYGFCTHNYGPDGKDYAYEKFVEAANSVNKLAFLDEEGPGSTFSSPTSTEPEKMDGVCGIYCRKAEFWKDGIQGELFFEVFSRDNKSKTRPVFFTDGGMAVRQRTYYVMKEYTNGISRKNMNYIPYSTEGINIGIGKDISFMAFANERELFLCIVNPQDESQTKVSISLPEEYSLGKAVRTVFEINLPPEGVKDELEYVDNSYTMDLPAKSVIFLSISLQ